MVVDGVDLVCRERRYGKYFVLPIWFAHLHSSVADMIAVFALVEFNGNP